MKTDDSASLQLPKVFSSAAFAASKRKTPSEFVLCQGVLPVMFPSLAAVWIFHFLEWTESLVTARLSRGTRGALEPILLQLTERAVRHATGVRGHRQAWVSEHFPGFNIVRLWRLSCGYLKEILEGLARGSRRRHLLCFFQVQTFDDPDNWQVCARWRRRELLRSPLREYSDLIQEWGLALFVTRQFCPSRDSELLVETWELQGLLYGWRVFAGVHQHTRVAQPDQAPDTEAEDRAMRVEQTYWATARSVSPL